ncbi:hypothetical protein PGT21_006818 [Puccinia graminis f. sp. tritici]|uniref:Alpha/beta-hydrolase n=1 Tax=Puccinia graminis f. sp. tritici TaxID=56615 RepID=A0A5B0Q5E5_PUCGR|nr:hypothetical protein PGT21_006818 [Puccinia graminis f. sp. tritici]KAA1138749.1 hypothetical protein PGTUg99_035820 [Puccinia graminis f. sp. tritici]
MFQNPPSMAKFAALITLSGFISLAFSRDIGVDRSNVLAKRQNQMGIVSGKGQYYDAKATPVGSLPPRTSGDAPWSQGEASYQKSVGCPLGLKNKAKGIVLLVPGTGGDASEAYKSSPYYQGLPSQGFDVCWVNIPNYSLGDMQLAAEFVAYAIKYLAPKSTASGGKINIVSYSQGGPNVQWASTFWPSIRKLVIGHVALAPPMKGTASTILLCPLSNLSGGCQPSVIQQTTGSNYMKAANSLKDKQSAAYALIPTTIIYSTTDEIVTPQTGPSASSQLIGATRISIQQICGILDNPGHFFILGDVGVYGIALDALLKSRPAQASTVDRSYCKKTAQTLGFQIGNLGNDLKFAFRVAIGEERGKMIATQLRTLRVPSEPLLQKYVCDRGYTTSKCASNGFKDKPTNGSVSNLNKTLSDDLMD